MFSLPQRSPPTANDIIYLDEEAATLEALLRMVCGQPVLRLESIDAVENILCAAEKYDMPGPMSISASIPCNRAQQVLIFFSYVTRQSVRSVLER
jgi:hypothetical protein